MPVAAPSWRSAARTSGLTPVGAYLVLSFHRTGAQGLNWTLYPGEMRVQAFLLPAGAYAGLTVKPRPLLVLPAARRVGCTTTRIWSFLWYQLVLAFRWNRPWPLVLSASTFCHPDGSRCWSRTLRFLRCWLLILPLTNVGVPYTAGEAGQWIRLSFVAARRLAMGLAVWSPGWPLAGRAASPASSASVVTSAARVTESLPGALPGRLMGSVPRWFLITLLSLASRPCCRVG